MTDSRGVPSSGPMAQSETPGSVGASGPAGFGERAGSVGLVSVVIPVYRSEKSLEPLMERLLTVLEGLDRPWEVVFVDDCSPDESWQALRRLKSRYGERVRIARLVTNRGQHSALLCGLRLSRGDVVVTMDDDLQNPPEEVPKLVAAIDLGFDLAIGAYAEKRNATLRTVGGRFVDWTQRRIFALPSGFELTSFRAISKVLVEGLRQMGTVAYPYITSMLLAQSANVTNIRVRHDPRPFGSSNYDLSNSVSLAANLVLAYSAFPLVLVCALSLAALLVAIAVGAWSAVTVVRFGASVPGWASTVASIAFFNSLILFSLAVLGVYVGRIHRQLSSVRAGYVLRELE